MTAGAPIAVALSHIEDGALRLKTFHLGEPAALSDILPMLENLGLRVVNEIPFKVTPRGAEAPVWIQEFQALAPKQASAGDHAMAGALRGRAPPGLGQARWRMTGSTVWC